MSRQSEAPRSDTPPVPESPQPTAGPLSRDLVQALEGEQRPSRLGRLVAWASLVVAIGTVFLWKAGTIQYVRETVDAMLLLSTASIVILLGMAGIYSYMCRFYADYFYALVALGWIMNAFYMCLEGFKNSTTTHLELWTYLFATLSFIPFYLAPFGDRDGLKYWKPTIQLFGWFAAIAIVVWAYLIFWRVQVGVTAKAIWVATVASIPYQVWTLTKLGLSVRTRLDPDSSNSHGTSPDPDIDTLRLYRDSHGAWGWSLPATFFLYAFLQLLSPIRLSDAERGWTIAVFAFALLTKIANSIAAAVVLATDFNNHVKQRSSLEELGSLTAGIEHDIRNPLNLSNGLIDSMRERFQAQSAVIAELKKLEEQNRRIFAATEVVRVLRGDEHFYGKYIQKTSINDIVSRSVKAVKDGMATAGIQFYKPEYETIYVMACAPLLQQAMVNIFKNAVEAIYETEKQVGVIRVELGRLGADVLVEISDTGTGIASEYIDKLGRFYSTKNEKKPNSGIGLFISSRILAFHRGGLRIESAKGTKVTLSIPAWKG